MDHHVVDGFLRVLHEPPGEADPVFRAAAAEAFFRAGDGDAGGTEAHDPAVIGRFFRQNGLGPGDQLPLLVGGGLRTPLPPFPLDGLVRLDPAGVPGHEVVDPLPVQPRGGPDQDPAVPGDLQGQGPAAGADQLIWGHCPRLLSHPSRITASHGPSCPSKASRPALDRTTAPRQAVRAGLPLKFSATVSAPPSPSRR